MAEAFWPQINKQSTNKQVGPSQMTFFLVFETTCENMFFFVREKNTLHGIMALLDFFPWYTAQPPAVMFCPWKNLGLQPIRAKHAITRGWLVGSLRRPSLVAHFFLCRNICRHFLETVCCYITYVNPWCAHWVGWVKTHEIYHVSGDEFIHKSQLCWEMNIRGIHGIVARRNLQEHQQLQEAWVVNQR